MFLPLSIMRLRKNVSTRLCWLGLWGILVAMGLMCLWTYDSRPGAPAPAPQSWPSDSALPRRPGLPTLIVFLHPRCPCSKATLHEFERVVSGSPRSDVLAVFYRPETVEPGWEDDRLWRQAEIFEGVHSFVDIGGHEIRRFSARVSGTVMLYDASGRLEFAGGITASRGHEGSNDGRSALVALLQGQPTEHSRTAVFGCDILGAAARR
jgi:hypothetical protein